MAFRYLFQFPWRQVLFLMVIWSCLYDLELYTTFSAIVSLLVVAIIPSLWEYVDVMMDKILP